MIHVRKRLADEIYARMTGKFIEGQTELDMLSKRGLVNIFRGMAKEAIRENKFPRLTKEQKARIRDYYSGCPRFSTIYHRVYAGRTGKLDLNFMPDDLYYGYIEPFYNNSEAARYIDNKATYDRLFNGIKMPEKICSRESGLWYDGAGQPVSKRDVISLLRDAGGELVLKNAENSEAGAGVTILSEEDPVMDFRRAIRFIHGDALVQRAVIQHPDYAALHPESVNSIRVMTLLREDGVHVITSCMRVGVGETRTDNLGTGGFFLGIRDDGTTGRLSASKKGHVLTEHPTMHYVLEGKPLPHLDKAYELASRAHLMVPRFRLVCWDIAIDEAGEAVLLETNLSLGEIVNVQVCNGPLFGEDTRAICEEVFGL